MSAPISVQKLRRSALKLIKPVTVFAGIKKQPAEGRRKLGIIQVFRRSFPPELSDRYRVSARITLYRSVCSNKKIAGEKLLRTAADAIFAKDKAQGPDHPGGYPTPATQYFTNKCAAAAIVSLICTAQTGGTPFFILFYEFLKKASSFASQATRPVIVHADSTSPSSLLPPYSFSTMIPVLAGKTSWP